MYAIRKKKRCGFSLIELVIVIVIIGIIGAIAIPRMSRGAAGAADSALTGNLAVLRNAIDLYHTEHGGIYPTAADIEAQLLTFTDEHGNTNDSRNNTYIFGPYLRAVPPLPVGSRRGETGINTGTIGTDPGGWWYDEDTGEIRANLVTAEEDQRAIPYNTY